MSDEARAYVKKYSPFTNSTFWVHYVLADIANAQHGYELWVTDQQLVDEWALSIGSIRRAYSELRAQGFLTLIQTAAPNRRAKYRFEFLDVPMARSCQLSTGKERKVSGNVSQYGIDVSHIEKRSPIYETEMNRTSLANQLFDAISSVCGIDTGRLTASGRGSLNRAVKELSQVGATADEIEAVAKRYRAKYPDAALTPSALSKHYATLGAVESLRTQSRALSEHCEECNGSGWKHVDIDYVGGASDVTRCDACQGVDLS